MNNKAVEKEKDRLIELNRLCLKNFTYGIKSDLELRFQTIDRVIHKATRELLDGRQGVL